MRNKVRPRATVFHRRQRSRRVQGINSYGSANLLLNLRPVQGVRVLFVILIDGSSRFAVANVPPGKFRTSLRGRQYVVRSLPPTRPSFVFRNQVACERENIRVMFPVRITMTLLGVLRRSLVLICRTLTGEQQFLRAIAVRSLGVRLNPRNLRNLQPQYRTNSFYDQSTFLAGTVGVTSGTVIDFRFVPYFLRCRIASFCS